MASKLRSKKFWISFAGIVIMLLQLFGVKVNAPYVNELLDSVCAVCILVGLLDAPKDDTEKGDLYNEDRLTGNDVPSNEVISKNDDPTK